MYLSIQEEISHLLHKACQILCTLPIYQCHSQRLQFLTLTPNIPILFSHSTRKYNI